MELHVCVVLWVGEFQGMIFMGGFHLIISLKIYLIMEFFAAVWNYLSGKVNEEEFDWSGSGCAVGGAQRAFCLWLIDGKTFQNLNFKWRRRTGENQNLLAFVWYNFNAESSIFSEMELLLAKNLPFVLRINFRH